MPIIHRLILIVIRMSVDRTAAARGFARQLISGASHGSPDPDTTLLRRFMSRKVFAIRHGFASGLFIFFCHSFASRLLVFGTRLDTGRWSQFNSSSSCLPVVIGTSICDRVVHFAFVHF